MNEGPCGGYVRARYMQTFLRHIDRLPTEDRLAIRAAIDPAICNTIERAGGLTWLPVEHNLDVTRAVSDRLGPRRTHEFFVTLMLSTFETSLFKSFIRGVLRVLGDDVQRGLRWVAKGYELMFRDAGEWRIVESSPEAATLELGQLPERMALDRGWLQTTASSLHSVFELVRVEGAVTVQQMDPKARKAVFRLRWMPRTGDER